MQSHRLSFDWKSACYSNLHSNVGLYSFEALNFRKFNFIFRMQCQAALYQGSITFR